MAIILFIHFAPFTPVFISLFPLLSHLATFFSLSLSYFRAFFFFSNLFYLPFSRRSLFLSLSISLSVSLDSHLILPFTFKFKIITFMFLLGMWREWEGDTEGRKTTDFKLDLNLKIRVVMLTKKIQINQRSEKVSGTTLAWRLQST